MGIDYIRSARRLIFTGSGSQLTNTLVRNGVDSFVEIYTDDDAATFIVYNPAKEKFAAFKGVAQMADREVMLQLPVDFTSDVVHGYMQYTNQKGDNVSTTLYLGQVVVG